MADPLEEAILQQAERLRDALEDPEPRKFGEHDPTDDAPEDDEDGDDASDDANAADGATETTEPHEGKKTGVKGVLADYKHKQRQENAKRRDDARKLSEMMSKTALSSKNQDDDDDELDLEDDAFMREYEAQRLRQLSEQQQGRRGPRTVFGVLTGVNDEGFLRVVEKDYPGVPVIVHLTDDRIPASRRMNAVLVEVAQRFAYAKFVWYSAQAAGFDPDVLPVLLVYLNGDLQQSLIHTIDETGNEFTADDIEGLLRRHHAISESDRADASVTESLRSTGGPRKLVVSKAPKPSDADDDD